MKAKFRLAVPESEFVGEEHHETRKPKKIAWKVSRRTESVAFFFADCAAKKWLRSQPQIPNR
jgi:hypothetical protein